MIVVRVALDWGHDSEVALGHIEVLWRDRVEPVGKGGQVDDLADCEGVGCIRELHDAVIAHHAVDVHHSVSCVADWIITHLQQSHCCHRSSCCSSTQEGVHVNSLSGSIYIPSLGVRVAHVAQEICTTIFLEYDAIVTCVDHRVLVIETLASLLAHVLGALEFECILDVAPLVGQQLGIHVHLCSTGVEVGHLVPEDWRNHNLSWHVEEIVLFLINDYTGR